LPTTFAVAACRQGVMWCALPTLRRAGLPGEDLTRPGRAPARPRRASARRDGRRRGRPAAAPPLRLGMAIAAGIGLHNFSEGLAIGQAASSGALSLATLLIVGFGLHNATEGFGIVGPPRHGRGATLMGMARACRAGRWRADIPWHADRHPVRLLAGLRWLFDLAAGAIVYVLGEMLPVGRRLSWEATVWALGPGSCWGWPPNWSWLQQADSPPTATRRRGWPGDRNETARIAVPLAGPGTRPMPHTPGSAHALDRPGLGGRTLLLRPAVTFVSCQVVDAWHGLAGPTPRARGVGGTTRGLEGRGGEPGRLGRRPWADPAWHGQ
jgi:zinc transporter, ZIP family